MSTDPAGPLDDFDEAILAQLRAVHAELDPPPPGLTEQVCFALDLADIDYEIARLQDEALIGSGARGDSRSRTLTYEAAGVSLLVSVTELGEDDFRIDGWLAPADLGRVELRRAVGVTGQRAAIRQATPDAAGRFVFEGLRHGLIQIRVRPADGQAARGIITPAIQL